MKHIFFIVLLHLSLFLNAQYSYDILFQNTTDEITYFVCHDIINDEQIVLMSNDCNDGDTNCISQRLIYRITNSGDTLQLPFADKRNDTLFSIGNIIIEQNGDYFLTGNGWLEDSLGKPQNAFDYNIKWNNNEEILWENIHERPEQFGGFSISDFFKILKLSNGNYLVGKTISSGSPLRPYYYFIEVDAIAGNIVKEKLMPFTGGYLQGLTYTIDSSEIILHSGRTYNNECNRNTEGAIILDASTYDSLSSFCYNRDDDDLEQYWCVATPYNAKLSPNGKLIVAGTGDCLNVPEGQNEDYLFIDQYDSEFNLLKRVFHTDKDTLFDAGWMESLDINSNNEILIAGNHDRGLGIFVNHYSWIYLAKFDEDLNLLDERYLGGDAAYIVYSMAATSDGGIVVSGSRYDYLVNNNERDAFIIKTDGGLWVNQNEYSEIPVHSAIVYPNPGALKLSLRTTEYPSLFKLYDLNGKVIITKRIEDHLTQIETDFIAMGYYTWTLNTNERIIDKGKWIKITP